MSALSGPCQLFLGSRAGCKCHFRARQPVACVLQMASLVSVTPAARNTESAAQGGVWVRRNADDDEEVEIMFRDQVASVETCHLPASTRSFSKQFRLLVTARSTHGAPGYDIFIHAFNRRGQKLGESLRLLRGVSPCSMAFGHHFCRLAVCTQTSQGNDLDIFSDFRFEGLNRGFQHSNVFLDEQRPMTVRFAPNDSWFLAYFSDPTETRVRIVWPAVDERPGPDGKTITGFNSQDIYDSCSHNYSQRLLLSPCGRFLAMVDESPDDDDDGNEVGFFCLYNVPTNHTFQRSVKFEANLFWSTKRYPGGAVAAAACSWDDGDTFCIGGDRYTPCKLDDVTTASKIAPDDVAAEPEPKRPCPGDDFVPSEPMLERPATPSYGPATPSYRPTTPSYRPATPPQVTEVVSQLETCRAAFKMRYCYAMNKTRRTDNWETIRPANLDRLEALAPRVVRCSECKRYVVKQLKTGKYVWLDCMIGDRSEVRDPNVVVDEFLNMATETVSHAFVESYKPLFASEELASCAEHPGLMNNTELCKWRAELMMCFNCQELFRPDPNTGGKYIFHPFLLEADAASIGPCMGSFYFCSDHSDDLSF